jgi:hypothetical protein
MSCDSSAPIAAIEAWYEDWYEVASWLALAPRPWCLRVNAPR